MAVSLSKGGNVSLSKEEPNLKQILIGLGWNPRPTDGAAHDLDASAFLLGATGKCLNDLGFIFYNNKTSQDGAVVHQGDNRTGEGDGDDEKIVVDLNKVSPDIHRIAVTVTIHDAEKLRQNFGQVADAYIRIVNNETGREITRYDLTEDASTNTAMIFGEVYRHGVEWKFRAVGSGFDGGLAKMAATFGVNAS